MISKSTILKFLPVLFQNIIISTYGFVLIRQRYGKEYNNALKELGDAEGRSEQALLEEQSKRLRNFIDFAKENSPFYRELYKNIDLSKFTGLSDLATLPIVTKEVIRENIDSIYTVEEPDAIKSFTGGTTGKSLEVRFTSKDMQRRMAQLDYFKLSVGVDPFKSKKATFSGREFTRGWATSARNVFWRTNWAYKQRLYSTFDMTNENLKYYVADLNKYKPEVLNGFVSAIYQLAQFIEATESSLEFKVSAVFTTSETLLPHHRELIEKVFECKVYNQYASAEGAPFITECNEGSLHYLLDSGVIEGLDTEEGTEMLVTSFTTHGTPLIRYKIGDMVEFETGKCACGSNHPLVKSIEGRKVEYLYSMKHGKVSLSHLSDVIKGLPNSIKAVQFHQYKVEEIEVYLNVEKEKFSPSDEKKILEALIYRFGEDTSFLLKLVNDIPREKSGKFALIKNHVKEFTK